MKTNMFMFFCFCSLLLISVVAIELSKNEKQCMCVYNYIYVKYAQFLSSFKFNKNNCLLICSWRSKRIKDKHRGRWQSKLVRRKSNMANRKWK